MKKDVEIDSAARSLRDFSGIDQNFGTDIGKMFREIFPDNVASVDEMIIVARRLGVLKEIKK